VRQPKSLIATLNVGAIPAEHWTQDPAIGGGRLIGEACHFIDLLRFLTGSPIITADVQCLGGNDGGIPDDKATLRLGFADGSIGTIHYLANGHSSFPKERIEVFCAGRILQLDNFRRLRGYGWPGFRTMRLWRQDKGQKACVQSFVDAVRAGAAAPIPFDELMEVSRVTIALGEAALR
jgi:predicted dehydrogenase